MATIWERLRSRTRAVLSQENDDEGWVRPSNAVTRSIYEPLEAAMSVPAEAVAPPPAMQPATSSPAPTPTTSTVAPEATMATHPPVAEPQSEAANAENTTPAREEQVTTGRAA